MREFVLIFADLYLHEADERHASWAESEAARSLARVLATAKRSRLAHGWRETVSAALPASAAAPAALVGGDPASAWFATPVHLLAALDHVRMPRAGVLRLRDDEAACLTEDFPRIFAQGPHSLVSVGGTEGFLLTGLLATHATTHDPARVAGGDVGPWLPGGTGRQILRKMASELELWLHDHEVNRLRRERGSAPVSALWLWGGGADPVATRPDATLAEVAAVGSAGPAESVAYGDEAFVRAALPQAERRAVPAVASELQAPQGGRTLVVLRGVTDPAAMLSWVARASGFLLSGTIDRLQLVVNDRIYMIDRLSRWKRWRRAQRLDLELTA